MSQLNLQIITLVLLFATTIAGRLFRFFPLSISSTLTACGSWLYLCYSVLLHWLIASDHAQSEASFGIWCAAIFGGTAAIAIITNLPQKINRFRYSRQRKKEKARQLGADL